MLKDIAERLDIHLVHHSKFNKFIRDKFIPKVKDVELKDLEFHFDIDDESYIIECYPSKYLDDEQLDKFMDYVK